MTHTPGPWHAIAEPTLNHIRIGGGFAASERVATIAIHMTPDDSRQRADSQIIAAAPAMLAALQEIQQHARLMANDPATVAYAGWFDSVAGIAEIAIAAATGEPIPSAPSVGD